MKPSLGLLHPPDGKSNRFTKTHPEPSITDLPPILEQILCTTIHGFLKKYKTLSWVKWLRNG